MSRDAKYLLTHGWKLISRRKVGCMWLVRWRKGDQEGPQHWAASVERFRSVPAYRRKAQGLPTTPATEAGRPQDAPPEGGR